jgi:hypothetical protein
MRDWQDHGRTLRRLSGPHREAHIIRDDYVIGDRRRTKRAARLSRQMR